MLHPSPVRLPGEKQPDGLGHGGGQVGYGGVGGEDEIERLDDGGGIGQVPVLGAGVDWADFLRELGDFEGCGAFLEGNPVDVGDLEDWEEGLEGGGAFAVGAVVGVAGPVDADSRGLLLPSRDLFLPPLTRLLGQGWGTQIGLIYRREQVGDGGGDGFRGGLEEGREAHQRDVMGEEWEGVALGDDLDGWDKGRSFASRRMTKLWPLGEGLGDQAG